jgi:UDP-glucose 4-epimerase
MRILITGGAGFIGSHLAETLAREPQHELLVLDNLRRGRRQNLATCEARLRFLEGDIRDNDCLREAMQGVSVVFHLAAQANVLGAEADPSYSFSTNVEGSVNVLTAARKVGVRRVVFASSREVYGEAASLPVPESAPLLPKNAYGASKAAAEHYCRVFANEGLEVSVLRFANVYGPRDRDRVIPIFLDQALRDEPLALYGGEQLLDFVWIGTVVDALSRAAFGPSLAGPLNVGSGTGTSLKDLARRVVELTGSRSKIEFAPVRSVETVRFVADVTLARRKLQLAVSADPLFALSRLLPRYQEAATA